MSCAVFTGPGRLSKQDKLPKHDDPAVTCNELESKRRALESLCAPIMATPKPQPKPKPEKKEDKKEGAPKDAATESKDAAGDEMDTDGARDNVPCRAVAVCLT